jgi:hypothetical protein
MRIENILALVNGERLLKQLHCFRWLSVCLRFIWIQFRATQDLICWESASSWFGRYAKWASIG